MSTFWRFVLRRLSPVGKACCAAALVVALPCLRASAQYPSATPATPASAGSAAAAPATALPEPIYWKQNLFLIPYQWSSAADPSAAQAVLLFVSKDRGVTWQKISEARPQVKAFNYHAEGDGEFWFAIRTVDRSGVQHPTGPYLPELRVIVDTSMPRIESLAAQWRGDGALEMQWRGADANIDPHSWTFEAQFDSTDTWQQVPLDGLAIAQVTPTTSPMATLSDGQAAWQPPLGARPRALRATVHDRAGNSAAYTAAIAAPLGGAGAHPVFAPPAQGWVSSSDASSAGPPSVGAAVQPWPTGAVASAPFRLSQGAAPPPGDQFTSFGNPTGVGTPLMVDNDSTSQRGGSDLLTVHAAGVDARREPTVDQQAGPKFAPLEPHREASTMFQNASLKRLPAVDSDAAAPPNETGNSPTVSSSRPLPQPQTAQLPSGAEVKRVGSRTFALEYDLEDVGNVGISKVELWGTRDGGQLWRPYACDDDQRTPLVATVDEAGLYGFRIVVETAGGAPSFPPRVGDVPELWVEVDLHQPVAELTSIQLGEGNRSDHLVLRWRAEDDNLEPRPIGLFYSSRPAGPWTTIAANLENTGEFAWQLQRHLPERFYLRLEARDTAGNLAAFQTREPVIVPAAQPSARLNDVEAVGPTATSAAAERR